MTTRSAWSLNEDDAKQEESIHWINVIFIPFHPTFRLLALICCGITTFLAPTQAVIPLIGCWSYFDNIPLFAQLANLYFYCYAVFITDCCLHIAHRQVREEAMRRIHASKSGLLLLVDIIAFLPLFTMVSNDICPSVQIWPNILCFNKCLLLYRFFEYFSLASTHSVCKLALGFILVLILVINALGLLTILVTTVCQNCVAGNYTSWRVAVEQEMPSHYSEGARKFATYFYGARLTSQYLLNIKYDFLITMRRLRELVWVVLLIILGFIVIQFAVSPKIFSEFVLSMRRLYNFSLRAGRVVLETRRRNTQPSVAASVETYYSVIWQQRNGLTAMPTVYKGLPKCQRIDISMDISWPLFLHSPILRRTSMSFKRWLSQRVQYSYRMPQERFFVGPHCFTNLYYLKSGVVQLLSSDDVMSPLLSVSGGTIFGDISYYLPPRHRNLVMRCLTYCEVLTVTQSSLLQALRHFPDDRRRIYDLTRYRIQHALALYSHKTKVVGADRSDEESIAWIKTRWWQLAHALRQWKRSKREYAMAFPTENTNYHCPKFIGQLVLCSDLQLSSKSMFLVDKFPWVLSPMSSFIQNWRRLVKVILFIMLVVNPPNLTRLVIPKWFKSWQFFCDKIFAIDVIVALITARECDMESTNQSLATTMLSRVKTFYFLLDVLSTNWFDAFFPLKIFYFNRFLKLYMLFLNPQGTGWKVGYTNIGTVFWNIVIIYAIVEGYVFAYFFYQFISDMSQYFRISFWFGTNCSPTHDSRENCQNQDENIFKIPMAYVTESAFDASLQEGSKYDFALLFALAPKKVFLSVIFSLYLASAMYLKHRDSYQYQCFVSSTLELFKVYKLHPDLMLRMIKYLDCQWKNFRGVGVMYERALRDEPYDIYMKVHGGVAESVISASDGFKGASLALVRDIALQARYMVLPRGSTIFLFGVKCDKIIWLIKGVVRCEYHDDKGELMQQDFFDGAGIEHAASLMARPALQTFTTATDCEMLYIEAHEFNDILSRHELEDSYLKTVTNILGPVYDKMFYRHIKRHREYQKKLRSRMYHGRKSMAVGLKGMAATAKGQSAAAAGGPEEGGILAALFLFLSSFRKEPESAFMQVWMPLRAASIMIAIICWSLKGGIGVNGRAQLHSVIYYCNVINFIDVLLKLALPYYDERGLVQRQMAKTALRYASRSMLVDVLAILPWRTLFAGDYEDDGFLLMFKSLLTFAQIYMVGGYFDYLSDSCNAPVILFSVVKWSLICVAIFFEAGLLFMAQCSEIKENIQIWSADTCWLTVDMALNDRPMSHANISMGSMLYIQYSMYLHSMNFAQAAITKVVVGIPTGTEHVRLPISLFIAFCLLGLTDFFIGCMVLSRMVLASRSNALFMHSLRQLDRFLVSERIERPLIDRALDHFSYSWNRFRGVDFTLLGQRVGILFRQDLHFFFYKQSLQALDSVLQGGEPLMRELSGHILSVNYLPHNDIVREMDLCPYVYIVHRGRVVVSKHGSKLATLAKGCIFGQLDSPKIRPLRITARCDDYVDLLCVPLRTYHELLSPEVHNRVMVNPDSLRDFLTLRKSVPENPYNTLRYLLRGDTIVKLPYLMEDPVEAQKCRWLSRFLIVTHAVGPLAACLLVPLIGVLPAEDHGVHLDLMLGTDFIQLCHVLMQFFKMEIVVVRKRIETQYMRMSIVQSPRFYVDVLSLLVPLLYLVTGVWPLQYARLLRLHLIFTLYNDLSRSVKANWVLIFIRLSMLVLFLHQITCTYVIIACRSKGFPQNGPEFIVHPEVNATFDHEQWMTWEEYKTMVDNGGNVFRGCTSKLLNILPGSVEGTQLFSRLWYLDYVLCLNFVLGMLTKFDNALVKPESTVEVIFKIIMTYTLSLLLLWVSATAISAMMTRFYELYDFDYHVANLVKYLTHNQVAPAIINAVREYTKMLWVRQRGTFLPEIVSTAPLCLREDLFSSLYMHHLANCPCYRELPEYFRRQLVVRFERVIMLPGRFIVKQGDICPYMYFIHEGEVEKWLLDHETDEEKLMSVLTITGVFGIVSGLFPECPFSASYYTRTVVDLVFLRNENWQDLLDAYPEVKADLNVRARKYKEDNYRFHRKPDQSASIKLNKTLHTHMASVSK